jgi:hypothetical protein
MKQIIAPLVTAAVERPALEPSPLLLALLLSLRLRAVFPQIRQSATLLVEWTRAQLGLQKTWASEATSLTDELTAQRAAITACLRNDPPAHRRKIEAALDAIHAHQLAHAASLAPQAPAHLLRD